MNSTHFDVIVVGAGAAGMMAAMAAADEGAKVLQIEKYDQRGGTFLITGGSSVGAATQIQRDAGILDDTPERFYADCMTEARARAVCDPDVLRYYCQQAGVLVDWLDSLGAYPAEFRVPRASIYGEPWTAPRAYFPDGGMSGGKHYLRVMFAEHDQRVKRGGIELLLNTSLTDVVTTNGKVTGIKARGADRTETVYTAKAIGLCTGGYANNPGLIRKYKWPGLKDLVSNAAPTGTGDGLLVAERLGVKLVNMDQEMAPNAGGIADPKHPGRPIATANMDKYPGAIWVDLNGRRFINEDAGIRIAKTRLKFQTVPEMKAIVLLDHKIRRESPPIFNNMFESGRTWEEFDALADAGVVIKKADTLEELAGKLGLDPKVLQDTVTRYNGYVDTGKDADFDRKDLHYKIEQAPFYGFTVLPITVMTSGGPAHNDKQQVMDAGGSIMPGLYVAGEIAGYKGFGTGAGNIGALVFGRCAGEQAARHALAGQTNRNAHS